jgi:hypothetical protein
MSIRSEADESKELSVEQKFAMVQTLSAAVASYIAEDEGINIEAAFVRFYDTPVAAQLENFPNLLYREGPGYIYDLYREHLADTK